MNQKSRYWATTIATALITSIAIVQPAKATLNQAQIEAIARNSTVRIFSQTPGSGVIIQKQGEIYTVLTCAHIIATEDEYEVTTPDGQSYPIENATIRRLDTSDLAILQFRSPKQYKVIALGNSDPIKIGVPSYVSGFPLKNIDSIDSNYRFAPGHISANANRTLGQGYSMVYPNETFRGMSGGPLLNDAGELIGIHGQTLTIYLSTGGISQDTGLKLGFNMAIPIQTFYRASTELGVSIPQVESPKLTATVTADDYYLQAVEQYINKKPSGPSVLELTQKAIDLNPLYGDAYRLRGYATLARLPTLKQNQQVTREFQQALEDFDQAIRINPVDIEALNIRGFFRIAQNDPEGAIKDFDVVIALRPTLHSAYQYRGDAYSNLGNHQAALENYNQGIRLFPQNPQVYNSRGIAHGELEDLQGALAD